MIKLTKIKTEDLEPCLEYLNDPELYQNTCKIPSPYLERHFWDFYDLNQKMLKEDKRLRQFIIRNGKNEVMGGIGFIDLKIGKTHKCEIGYWIGKPHRGKGYATQAVKKICAIGFTKYKLKRISAITNEKNVGSQKVLLKCGFKFEGVMKNFLKKDGKIMNAKLFAKCR